MWLPAALVLNAAVILETLASSSNGSGGSAPSIAKQRTSCGRLRRRRCETSLVNGCLMRIITVFDFGPTAVFAQTKKRLMTLKTTRPWAKDKTAGRLLPATPV